MAVGRPLRDCGLGSAGQGSGSPGCLTRGSEALAIQGIELWYDRVEAKSRPIAGHDADGLICDLDDIGVEHRALLLHSVAVCRCGRKAQRASGALRGVERGEAVTVRLSASRAVYLSILTPKALPSYYTVMESGASHHHPFEGYTPGLLVRDRARCMAGTANRESLVI